MSTAKFEKLIDLILNEDQERAEQLFHDIVVEKSREIYENLMSEDDQVGDLIDEVSDEMEGADDVYEADDEMPADDAEMDMDDAEADMDDAETDMDDADMDMDDAEADMDDADMDMDDESSEPATKDDIMNLEDKLDELMAEFEALMNKEEDEAEDDMEADEEDEEADEEEVMESVEMKAAPKPKHEDHKATSPVAKNSGQAGMASKPVKFSGAGEEKGRPAPTAKPMGMKFKNSPGGGSNVDAGESAPKPKHEVVKAKSPVPESKRSTKKRL